MTTLGELLSKDNAKKLQNIKSALNPKRHFKPKPQRVIQQGDVFKIKATEENGITPKNGELYRWKFFVVIGRLADGTLHCCAAFDSDKNKEYIEPRFEEFFLPIKAGQYSFINHDWFAKGQDREVYDLAIIRVDGELTIPYFMLDAPAVLDEVLVMGFPPIANLPSIQTAETATIGAYQKASTGQVVANSTAYRTQMDFFLINARVKGGNSGGPVINKEGKVVGTVVALPYALESDPDNPRYDIMGYGQCLPSKYIEELLTNPEQLPLHEDGKYYSFR